MSPKIRPARSRRDAVTLPPDSEITQSKALMHLIRRPGDGLVEPRFFQSPELRALAEAVVELGDGAQAEAIVDAAARRVPLGTDIRGALHIAMAFGDLDDRELTKAVRELRALWASGAYRVGEITLTELNRYTLLDDDDDDEIVFVRADSVEIKPIRWLWPGYIPRGKVTLFAGRPKTAKSAMHCDFAARVSRGMPMPYADPGSAVRARVIMCMAEDDAEDMVVPRLIGAGADLGMIDILDFVRDGRGERGLDIVRDIARLERRCKDGEVGLIIFDPIMSFIGADTDTNNDASTRYALSPIKKLAETYGIAVILNSHQRKESGDDLQAAAMGSTAFTGIPRATFAVCHDPQDKDRKLVISTGMNVAKEPKTLAFTVRTSDAAGAYGAPTLTWAERPLDLDERGYRQLIREQAARDSGSELTKATDFLDRVLASGPMASKALAELARGEGISDRTLDRARKELDIARKKLADGTWMSGLPGAFDPAPDAKDTAG